MDIKFTVNTGTYKGKTYRYTLATVNGKKAWAITPLFSPPPSMIKNKIDIVISAVSTISPEAVLPNWH